MFNELKLPTTLPDLIKARNQAQQNMETAHELIAGAEALLSEGERYIFPYEAKPRYSVAQAMKEIDRRLWSRAFDLTGFRKLMDRQAVDQFQKSLDHDVPEFNEDNIRSTFLSLHQEADLMFRRGIVNTFRHLCRDYRTNAREPFRISEKLIIDGMVSNWSGSLRIATCSSGSHTLDDIDRVFKTLAGADFSPRALEQMVNAAWAAGADFEDEYFRIRGFKKGTAHIWFLRADLLDKVNELIAEHYGDNTLARAAA